MKSETRKLIAWKDIDGENLKLDDAQQRQLKENINRAKRDLREIVWRSYNKLVLLGRDNELKTIDLGLITSSAANSMSQYIINHLRQIDEIVKNISPRLLLKNWPPAFTEWSTKAVRDVFFASPQFPRLLNQEAIKDTIQRGVEQGGFALVVPSSKGGYSPLYYKESIDLGNVEISDDMFIIKAEEAEKHIKPPALCRIEISPSKIYLKPKTKQSFNVKGFDQFGHDFPVDDIEWTATGGKIDNQGNYEAGDKVGNYTIKANVTSFFTATTIFISKEEQKPVTPDTPQRYSKINWSGEIPPLKWMNFYSKVLSRFVKKESNLILKVQFEVKPEEGISQQQIDETKASLSELSLDDKLQVE
jgi:hypothetical protein